MSGQTNGHSNKHTNGNEAQTLIANGNNAAVRKPQLSNRTDYIRWRLLDERGRQTWHYLEDEEDVEDWPQSTADKYFLGLPLV